MKTTKNKICGGYLQIAWEEGSGGGGSTNDDKVFLFSIDHKVKFTPNKRGIFFNIAGGAGPYF
jgi:hypothetical protein